LARYLADHGENALSKALLEQNVDRPAKTIKREDWQGQAVKLSKQPAPSASWKPHTHFTLFFEYKVTDEDEPVMDERGERVWQARLYHNETGDHDPLPIEPSLWLNWILQRAQLPITRYPTEVEAVPAKVDVPPESTELESVLRVGAIEINEGSVSGILEKSLVAEVPIYVTDPQAERWATGQSVCEIQLYLANLEGKAPKRVETARDQVRLEPGKSEHTARIEFQMPDPGHYELQAKVILTVQTEDRASEPFQVVPYYSDESRTSPVAER
jgi:hypothetical protein